MILTIPGIPPGPNELNRLHFMARANIRSKFRQDAFFVAKEAMNREKWRAPERVSLVFTVVFSQFRRRDPDNLIAAMKPIIDGIVKAGVIEDDSIEYVAGLVMNSRIEPGATPSVIVEVIPA
jgi:Holliday junction resolvase RusA-like endonuclease